MTDTSTRFCDILFGHKLDFWVHWVKRHDMLAMATMYFYLATSVRLCYTRMESASELD
jgi:hypothetical protein